MAWLSVQTTEELMTDVLVSLTQVQERRAMRGLAASARLQGQYKTAIKHLESVLEISKAMQEYTGECDTDTHIHVHGHLSIQTPHGR